MKMTSTTLRRVRRLFLGACGLAISAQMLVAPPAWAHHSFAMFDNKTNVTLVGTVKSYEFRMPHTWFYIVVEKPGGKAEEWGMEMGSPNILARKGWHINSLKAGDKVTVTMHPMKNGAKAGSVVSVVLPDGKTLSNK